MSDLNFIREIDEEVRRDRMLQLWKRHGNLAIGIAVLVVLATGAWRGWQWHEHRESAKAGAHYEEALSLAQSGKQAESEQALTAIAKDAPSGYRMLAQLRLAAETGKKDAAAGVKAYDAIAADSSVDPLFRDVARLRAAYLLVDTAAPAEIESRVKPLTGADSPFKNSAKEVLALSYFRTGDKAKARALYTEILTDPQVTSALASRAQMMQALTTEGAAKPAAAQ
jgi:hypothetical protein